MNTASKTLSVNVTNAIDEVVREIDSAIELMAHRAPKIVALARALVRVNDQPGTTKELAGLIEDLADALNEDARVELKQARQGLLSLSA